MSNQFDQSTIAECQAKFNLTYHVSYAYTCQNLVGFQGKDVLEVGGSLPEEFVFDYLNVNSWTGLETPEYEIDLKEAGGITHQGTVISEINDIQQYKFSSSTLSGRYNFFLENIEDLPSQYYEKYDLVFSIAAFEHIQKFPAALEKMYLALKPGGKLFSMFSPIWSAHDGHHLPEITDKQGNNYSFGNSPIPPWGHLRMSPPTMCKHLYQFTDKETADRMVYYIYNSPFINRFFTEDYIEFINQSSFQVSQLNLTFQSQIDPQIQKELEERYQGKKNFTNNGILAVLEKPLLAKNNRQLSVKTSQYQNKLDINNYPSFNTLLFLQNPRNFYPQIIFSQNEIFCSPDCKTKTQDDGIIENIQIPVGIFDVGYVKQQLPSSQQQPELIVVKADAARRVLPVNLDQFNCPKLLIVGDTHHLRNPLQTLLSYAKEEKFDFVMSLFNPYHLHYFKEVGFDKVFWIPTFYIDPYPQVTSENYEHLISFVGQVRQFHPYRRYILDKVKEAGFVLNQQKALRPEAARIYANSLINLNISLNGDLNMRVFEVLSSGGFLLTDRLSKQARLNAVLEEGKHFVAYEDEIDLLNKISYYSQHPEEARQIAKEGEKAFWENYRPDLNVKRILDYMDGKEIEPYCYPEWDKRSIYAVSENTEEFNSRIAIYEYIQEWHRVDPKLQGLFFTKVDYRVICDLVDLPRLDIYLLQDNEAKLTETKQILTQYDVLEQVCWTDSPKEQSWNFIALTIPELYQIGIDHLLNDFEFKELVITDYADNIFKSQLLERIFANYGLVKCSQNPLVYKWSIQKQLKLRPVNLIIFPGWNQPEEQLLLLVDLARVMKAISSHPDVSQITLVIDTDTLSEEDANLVLSSVAMNLMMEEEIDLSEQMEIAITANLDQRDWNPLLRHVQGRLQLKAENLDKISQLQADKLPIYQAHSLDQYQVIKSEQGSWSFVQSES
ncbi:MAG: glycosyltransferase [Cyanobacteria bacterium]|jgi:SAM-dependent methyltransferase|nr:glycosyltransferase [Cyanobacteria bacterium GSL.Bin1]